MALAAYAAATILAGAGAAAVRHGAAVAGRTDLADRLAQRLSRDAGLSSLPRGGLWLHAASVGEARAAAPLARALRAERPQLPLLVSTTTPTGRRCALEELEPQARLAPWDSPGPLARYLRATAPRAHVSVETEIWPLRLRRLQARGVPCAVVSARLSADGMPRYRKAAWLYGPALAGLSLVCPAGDADRERLLSLGVRSESLGPMGSLKWDACPDPPTPEHTAAVRERLGLESARRWTVLGSVHPGETAPLLSSIAAQLSDEVPWGALVAPRHPSRFDQIWEEIAATGLPAHRASRGPAEAGARVVLVDALGVLPTLYPLSTAAFVGGTLVAVGGHSPLEAAASSVPIAYGPHDVQQAELLAPLADCGAAVRGDGAQQVAGALSGWLRDPAAAARDGAAARQQVDRNRGIGARLARALLEVVP